MHAWGLIWWPSPRGGRFSLARRLRVPQEDRGPPQCDIRAPTSNYAPLPPESKAAHADSERRRRRWRGRCSVSALPAMVSPCWTHNPRAAHTRWAGASEPRNLTIEASGDSQYVPQYIASSQCLAMVPGTKRWSVIVAATVTTASNGPCSSIKVSCTRTSLYWRTESNRRAPMSLLPVAV
ncbi:hypothetical protein Tc00.1047053511825.110 [Trypanosoma cruzi]|uniref:Uncharacterized protein n=1 Tax=Trypanosoma cruzi (strain CL Brener) TaxID=353153 RepID=Q4DQ41_TRYCC|nr:hypothetical protein Tc00.1047053511825.110 [Trypanosoma cruzi]EAN94640.1 hypothetical protein Tc00.1047053511825.110 [Trypanosoma cruzi]|eukprot:XP_816491.1 hypothetical protein [Trypanosoma cruzi strain CL Brener]